MIKSKKIIQPLAASLLLVAVACVSEAEQDKATSSKDSAVEVQAAVMDEAVSSEGSTDVVAEIGEFKITREELETELKRQLRGQESQLPTEQLHGVRIKMLDKMIERELFYNAASQAGLLATDEDVEKTLAGIKSQLGSDEAFTAALESEKVSQEEFMAQLKKDLAVNNYLKNKIFSEISVSDEDVEKFYNESPEKFSRPAEVSARHILFKVAKDATADVVAAQEKKANEVLEKAKAEGADFAALARDHSEGPTAPKGGDLGFFTKNQMVAPFAESAFSLGKGEISGLVRTDFGFHIIKVEDKREAGVATLDEVKEDLKNYLSREKQQELLSKEIEKLKSETKVITYMK